jgi:MFS family permease
MGHLLKGNRPLRRFVAAFFQSQVGTGAAYVALLLVAYHRLHSAWAIALVLLGEFLPGIILSPVFGSLADRVSRRRLAVAGDLLRASAFVALALIPSFTATVALALLAGVGTAIFRPAINAGLPAMVAPADRSRLVAVFYASVNTGLMLGPALAAAMLTFTTAHTVLLLDALTFIVSALLLSTVDLGPHGGDDVGDEQAVGGDSIWAETWTGSRAAFQIPGVAVVLGVGALVVVTGAMFNVLAPLLATGPLHAGGTGYGVLWAFYGTGMVAGSWANARVGSQIAELRRRWLWGIALSGIAMVCAAVASNLAVALIAFTLIGLSENLLVGPEMRLVQELVSERLLGRVFGVKDVLENIAFVTAFVGAGALLTVAGVRVVFVGAGLATVALALFGALKLRPPGVADAALAPADASEPALAPSE